MWFRHILVSYFHSHTCLLNAPSNSLSQLPELSIKEPRYTKLYYFTTAY
ncbi:unnamed protein product [Callosobruchus maculatus]|uniref:Uncharacterized protein n=1 Tax=Callosobruchus maculatus TaxID=64391 RepID=A0A653BYD4_CALMS|nr:unnamed protein product [Callosobruchus maculatus]